MTDLTSISVLFMTPSSPTLLQSEVPVRSVGKGPPFSPCGCKSVRYTKEIGT